MSHILEELDSLPDSINLRKDSNWVKTTNGIEPKSLHEANTITTKLELENSKVNRRISNNNEGLLTSLLKLVGLKKDL